MTRREVLDHLKGLHEKHGGVLFRRGHGRRAPYWVSVEALRLHWAPRFGQNTAQGADLLAVHARLDALQALVERALESSLERRRGVHS